MRHAIALACALLSVVAICGEASAAPLTDPSSAIAVPIPPPPPPPPLPPRVVYTGFVVTDVSLGGVRYHNALVTMKFVGLKSAVFPFSKTNAKGYTGSGWEIREGTASVQIVSGAQVIDAVFNAGQVFVSFDQANGGFGFGSIIGNNPQNVEPAYPLGIDAVFVNVKDLVTPVAQSGRQWSCIGVPVSPPLGGTGRCGNPVPLQTDHGPFIIYMQYFDTDASGLIQSDYGGALNQALFKIDLIP
ncbi:MAG: hypothetical protein JO133_00225 [Burkholderiaceae bacterium]|nr:hypothetical protein [Burkholderiaceae bacterium]